MSAAMRSMQTVNKQEQAKEGDAEAEVSEERAAASKEPIAPFHAVVYLSRNQDPGCVCACV